MQYLGKYRGIIFKNDDPLRSGRVKVWVPFAHREIYQNDIDLIDGKNVNAPKLIGDYSKDVVDSISEDLPWAEIAQPMIGGGGSAYSYQDQESYGDGFVGGSSTGITARVTRYGFATDRFANANDRARIGNNANTLFQGVSVALSPELYQKLGIGRKSGSDVYVTFSDGSIRKFRADDQTAPNLSPNIRIDFFDPEGEFISIDGSDVTVSLQRNSQEIDSSEISEEGNIINPETPPTPPLTQSPAASLSSGSCENNFSINSGVRIFCGSRNDLKIKTGSFSSRAGDRKISLDFNAATPSARGFEVILPSSGTTPEEEQKAQEYLTRLEALFTNGGLSRPNRGIKRISSSLNVIFTEPFFNQDTEAAQFIFNNISAYNKILLETLGSIQGSTLIAPHNSNAGGAIGAAGEGAVTRLNGERISEREFAMRYIVRPLAGGSIVSTCDAFSAVGNKHPEEARDEVFLKEIGISDSDIERTISIGKEIFEASELAKTKPSASNVSNLNLLKTQRDELWNSLTTTDIESRNRLDEYISSRNLDYTEKPINNKANPASKALAHTPYSNVSHGSFTIPEVGANVWVFFEAGNIDFPVVDGLNPKPQDYAGIYDISSPSPDYPEAQEGDESNIHRNKTVFNSRGGSVEMVDTTGKERLKFTSYHGGSYEMNQLGNQELVNGGKTQLVRGDKFTTVRGDDSYFTQGDREIIVKGDIFHKFGNVKGDADIAKRIKNLHKPIHDKQQLFDLQRTNSNHPLDSSPLQKKDGINTKCPTCSGETKFTTRNTTSSKFTPARPTGKSGTKEILETGESTVEQTSENPETCFNCQGSGNSPWSAEGDFRKDPIKQEIVTDINNNSEQMSELENRLSNGGNLTEYITRSQTVFVGTEMNDLNSIRVDPVGKKKITGQMPSENGVFPMYSATPHVEHVAVNSLAGGDYSMSVSNKYSLMVGSNGIDQKTLGPYNIQGRIMTIAGDQVNISSNNEVLIDGGRNVTITGDTVSIMPRTQSIGGNDYKTVALDSSVSVSSNMVVKGGIHNEGGMTTQHITAPLQYSETETTLSMVSLIEGTVIGKDSMGGDVIARGVVAGHSEHSHTFPTISSTLLDTNADVRKCGNAAAGADPILAPPVEHVKSRLKGKQAPIRFKTERTSLLDEDCNDDDFNKIIDFISDNEELPDDFEDILTRASDSPVAASRSNDCDPCG